MEKRWWKEAVVYQIYTRSFKDSNADGIGDIPGIIEKLPYLDELGVDLIWLNPIYRSPNDDNGYDISNYRDIMAEFGSMEDFDRLLDACHRRNMRLIMDLVVNHSSDEHPWFQASRSARDSYYRDYYVWRPGRENGPPNNWRSFFGGPAWDLDSETGEYYLHLFSPKQPDLNWENPRVRREVRDIMRFWLDKGVDGFRMDVINLISKVDGLPDGRDPEGLTGHEFFANGPRLGEYFGFIKESLTGYDAVSVGETVLADLETVAGYVDEKNGFLNMAINFEHVSLDRDRGSFDPIELDPRRLKENLAAWQRRLDGRGWNCLYLSNHDQPRQVSRFGDDRRYHQESAKMLATLLHTLQGTPFIMQGEEIGMTNVAFESIEEYRDISTLNYYRERVDSGEDPAAIMQRIHVCSRDNARTPMQWDTSVNAGFSSGRPWIGVNPDYASINAASQYENPDSILNYYRKLIRLRKAHPLIVYGDFVELDRENPRLFAYERLWGEAKLRVVLNLSSTEAEGQMPPLGTEARPLIGNYPDQARPEGGVLLRPYEAICYLDNRAY